jgi:hypothetical protein
MRGRRKRARHQLLVPPSREGKDFNAAVRMIVSVERGQGTRRDVNCKRLLAPPLEIYHVVHLRSARAGLRVARREADRPWPLASLQTHWTPRRRRLWPAHHQFNAFARSPTVLPNQRRGRGARRARPVHAGRRFLSAPPSIPSHVAPHARRDFRKKQARPCARRVPSSHMGGSPVACDPHHHRSLSTPMDRSICKMRLGSPRVTSPAAL